MLTTQNNTGYIRSLQTLFFSLLFGQIAVFIILWFGVNPPVQPGVYQNTLDLLFIGIWAISRVLAFFLPRKLVEEARAQTSFDDKLATYRRAQVMRLALMEGSVLLCLVGYFFVTANYILLALAAVGIALFIPFMPSRNKITRELELTSKEEMMLDAA